MATQVLTTADVAAWLQRPEETLRYWRWKGIGPRSYKVGRATVYDEADVLEWLAEQKKATGAGGGRAA